MSSDLFEAWLFSRSLPPWPLNILNSSKSSWTCMNHGLLYKFSSLNEKLQVEAKKSLAVFPIPPNGCKRSETHSRPVFHCGELSEASESEGMGKRQKPEAKGWTGMQWLWQLNSFWWWFCFYRVFCHVFDHVGWPSGVSRVILSFLEKGNRVDDDVI